MKTQTSLSVVVLGYIAMCCSPTLRPERPEAQHSNAPQVPNSFINVSLEAATKPLLDEVKRSLVVKYEAEPWRDQLGTGGPDHPHCGIGAGYKMYTKEKEIKPSLSNNELNTDVTFYYWLKARARVPCKGPLLKFSCGTNGESEREMAVEIKTRFDIEPNWSLNVSTLPASIKPINECRLGGWGIYDATPKLKGHVKTAVDRFTSRIDTDLEKRADLRHHVSNLWAEMHKPQRLDDSVFLIFNTSKLYTHPVEGDNQRIKFGVQVEARPELYIGGSLDHKVPELPDAGLAPKSNTFKIFLPVHLAYQRVRDELHSHFKIDDGNFLRFPPTGKKWFYVKDLAISGYNDKTIIRLELDGKVKGWIYLSGIPKYDKHAREIYFDNIEISADSKSWIVRKAGWLLNELPGFTRWMTNKSRTNVSDELEKAQLAIDTYLNSTIERNGTAIKLNGNLNSFDFKSLYADTNHETITFYFHANGDVAGIISSNLLK